MLNDRWDTEKRDWAGRPTAMDRLLDEEPIVAPDGVT